MEVQVQHDRHDKQPTRTCAGCRVTGAPGELVRVVLGDDHHVVVDLAGGAFGRGAWLHVSPECIERAVPRGLAKSFKREVKTTAAELRAKLVEAAERRIAGLLSGARGGGRIAVGTSATDDEIEAGRARLIVVAADARAAATSGPVQRMIAAGKAVAWADKQRLGNALGRGEIGVLAVSDSGIAVALRQAIAMSHINDDSKNPKKTGKRRDFSEEG